MLRRMYNKMLALAERPAALPALAVVSFAESSFFPIPPDVMLIPMVLARPKNAWLIAGVCTVASVIGGLFGYAIGFFLLETMGAWIIDLYHLDGKYESFQAMFTKWGIAGVAAAGFTPIPYKIITIASGAAKFSLPLFFIASAASRGARFFLVAATLRFFGEPIRGLLEKYLGWITAAAGALAVGGFAALKLLH